MATSIESSLQACVKITDDNKRLVCFDRVANTQIHTDTDASVDPIKSQSNSSAKAISAQKPADIAAPVQSVRKETIFGKEHQIVNEGLQELTLTIKSLKKNAYKQYIFTFENDQVWQQKDDEYLRFKSGDKVIISRGALSSFYLKKPNSNRNIKVKRLQ